MERKFQTLLDKILRQIFIKKMENPAETTLESQPSNLPAQKATPAVVTFVFSIPARQPRSPEYYQSPEYFARLRQKMRVCFKQEKEVIHSSDRGESFEKKLRINEIENCLEDLVLFEYEDLPLFEKIARVENLQEIYRKMVKNRQSGY
jgi:hypothetical protein